MVRQKLNRLESLYLINEDRRSLISEPAAKGAKIISSQTDFENFIKEKFLLKQVCIQVELNWNGDNNKFYGYEIAKILINNRERQTGFNLFFISEYQRQALFDINQGRSRIFTQKFSHVQINADSNLYNIKIQEISEKKFDYLCNYCLLKSGIIDRLIHDLRNLLNDITSEKLQKLVQGINTNSDILTSELIESTQRLSIQKSSEIKNTLSEIYRQLLVLQVEENNPEETLGKKSHSVVMIIEDDEPTLVKLSTQFGYYFHNVISFQKGTEAYNEIKNNGKKYDAVITDLELLDGNFDDEILGIDILELCEREFPFIVTRVITSLPKNALKRLIGKGLDEIIFKSIGSESVIPPFENVVEFVHHIDKDVSQRKVLRSMPGPKYSWWGKFLTRKLYLTQIENSDEFISIWNKAKYKATLFLNGDLEIASNQEKISTELKQVSETVTNPKSGWGIIELLLTHRLIAIGFASQHNWDEFYYSGDGEDVYVNQKGFQTGMESKPSKTYFNTFLGLSVAGSSDKREERLKCKINPQDFFPEEIEWLSKHRPAVFDNLFLRDVNDDFQGSFLDFMQAYNQQIISDDVTFGEALQFLDNFINEYPEGKNNENRNSHLKSIFEQKLFESFEQLPEEIKVRIKKIKEEIFYL